MSSKSKIIKEIEQIEENILEDIRNNLNKKIYPSGKVDISLWLFYYQEIFDALVHWKLLSNNDDDEKNVSGAYIPRGNGTIGYILDTMHSEFVDDTFDDPRGSVAIEDEIIGNLAWGGIPIPKDVNAKIPISIISLFPKSKPSWGKKLKKVESLSNEIIKGESEKLKLLTYVKILREQIEVLYDDIEFDSQNYDDNISKLLDKIRTLAYKTIKFENIVFISKDNDKENYKINKYKFLKHNYIQRRLKIINELRWSSFIGQNYLTKLDEDLKTIKKVSIEFNNYNIIVYLNREDKDFEEELVPLLKQLENVFSRIVDHSNNKLKDRYFKNQKLMRDTIILIFRAYCKYSFADPNYSLEELRSELSKITVFISNTFKVVDKGLELNGFNHKFSNTNVIAIGINEKCNDQWSLQSNTLPELEEKLKDNPGEISVLARLIGEIDKSGTNEPFQFAINYLNKYSLRNEFSIESIVKESNKIQLEINYNSNTGNLIFVKDQESNYLLDVQLNVVGYENFLYNSDNSIEIKELKKETNSFEISSKILKNFGLAGEYILLCKSENNRELILIGPREEKNENEDYELLKEFAQKSYKKLILIETQKKLKASLLKTAIISILIDSYAHNISAHSLAALKWWIELRHKMLDKRIKIEGGSEVNCLQPSSIIFNKDKNEYECKISSSVKINNTIETTLKYYEALGLKDSTYNQDYYSLFDFLQFADTEVVKSLFRFENVHNNSFHPRFPIPIDYALYPFFRFLRDKGAFWSGVTRDMAFGGESKTWYKILWEDFVNNPLYLGTIAKSEGITKININLEVKQNKKLLHKGRFVTIDMSVIEYEEKLSQDPNLDSYKWANLLINDIKEDKECKTCKDFVDYDKYSKYAFVKLGKCFNKFRKILDDEENFRVYLPGGIIGEHALFTIFENQIRNIKHYKDKKTLENIRKNGIDFWISIEEDKLRITKQNENNEQSESSNKGTDKTNDLKKPAELFKVGVWLGHETKLITKEETKNYDGTIKEPAECLLFTITENTLKPILDESTGAPRMGGNSQDKACAAMLFNSRFSSVEDTKTPRGIKYFPWIEFKTQKNGEVGDGVDLAWNDEKKIIIEDSKLNYEKLVQKNNSGILKKYFYLWRGEDVFTINLEIDLYNENIARFKFLILGDSIDKEKSKIDARKEGVIRIFDKSIKTDERLKPNERVELLYNKWLIEKWIKKKSLTIELRSGSPLSYIVIENGDIFYKPNDNKIICKDPEIRVELSHGGNDKDRSCNVRSHGYFWNKFFEFIDNKDLNRLRRKDIKKKLEIDNLTQYPNDKKHLLYEFTETLHTKIMIYDNRVYLRMPNDKEEKIKRFKELGLVVKKEELEAGNNNFREQFISDKNLFNRSNEINFLIMHLSYIESIEDKNGAKYDEKRLAEFFNDNIPEFFNQENSIFVLTSGRGRKGWEINLNGDKKLLSKFIFKPVESLLNAVESGLSYEDDFDVKYNLVKLLFNS